MAFFGIGHLVHILPQQKNAFWGVRGVGGAPGGRFFEHFLRFLLKMGTKHLRLTPSNKLTAFFGIGHINHTPLQQKNAFWGVTGGPRGTFFCTFFAFFAENGYETP